jgi:hypothetical protein
LVAGARFVQARTTELQRHRFGHRGERLDSEQLALALEDVEQTLAAADAAAENGTTTAQKQATPRRRHINRGALPIHLTCEEIVVDVPIRPARAAAASSTVVIGSIRP